MKRRLEKVEERTKGFPEMVDNMRKLEERIHGIESHMSEKKDSEKRDRPREAKR